MALKRGDLVRVGPAWAMGNRVGDGGRYVHDGHEGFYTVVKVMTGNDFGLVRGNWRHDVPEAADWEVAIHGTRLNLIDYDSPIVAAAFRSA